MEKKFLTLTIFTICICLLSINIKVSANNDGKTVISTVTGSTDNYASVPVYGLSVENKPTVTVSTGLPAQFLIDQSNGDWQKKVGDEWVYQFDGNFTEGTWRFRCQIRIDGPDAQEYKLADPVSVFVNDEELETEPTFIDDNYSYAMVNFPEITIEKPEYTKGDINDDGSLSLLDIRLTLEKMLNNDYTNEEKIIMDYNEDGSVTLLDIRAILQAILN